MNPLLRRFTAAVAVLGAGAVLGATGALAGTFDGPVPQVVSLVFAGGWSWACFGFLVGYTRKSKAESALLACPALAVGVIVYYGLKALHPAAPIGMDAADGFDTEVNTAGILVWGTAALLLGAPMGFFGNLARLPGIAGLPFRLLVPLIVCIETSSRLAAEADAAGRGAALTWSALRVIAVLVAAALVGHVGWTWRARRNREQVGAGSDGGTDHPATAQRMPPR
ncbi:hypothetical protein [Streptomyces sp. NPDC058701]|uniref:hypothetical protein n=1 Tax=Streptomyces sp. NPDC058701 TaxID=3346608 RepID=UPI003650071B